MAKLATCPGCTTQLALPEDATLSDRARCPRCHEEFLLMETVQFSIPTAEILPPPEPDVSGSTDTLSPAAYVPEQDVQSELRDEVPEEMPEQAIADEPEPASESLPRSATLSDWEARLKRAIATSADEDPLTASASEPALPLDDREPLTPELPVPAPAEPVTYEPQDFAVPEEDLFPETTSAAVGERSNWVGAEFVSGEDDEPTVKFTADQTISDVSMPQVQTPVAVRAGAMPRMKRKRSPLRTVISASLGVIGIPLGLYALLWLRGPAGDMLHIAQYLPALMLPAEFNERDRDAMTEQIAREPIATDDAEAQETLAAKETESETMPDAGPLVREDPSVAPASVELPTYQGPTFDLVDSAEFNVLLAEAQRFAHQLTQGDLKSKESVASKGQAYMALARLADKSTFLNQPGHSADDSAKAQLAKELLQATLHDEIVRRDLPQIALRWWQYAERPSTGIVLVGEVKRLQSTAAGDIAFLALSADGVTPAIPVLVGHVEHHQGELIGIAGTIESNLQQRLPSIDASHGPAVIAHYSFPLVVPE